MVDLPSHFHIAVTLSRDLHIRDAIFFAVQSLSQRYKDAVGFEGKRVSGKSVKGQGVKGFRSQAELARAISDPRYRTDPAYRLDIQDRLAASGDLL